MKKLDPKIVAAISAAIGAYIQTEAAPFAEHDMHPVPPQHRPASLWALSGRQDTMLHRRSWQMRIYGNRMSLQRK